MSGKFVDDLKIKFDIFQAVQQHFKVSMTRKFLLHDVKEYLKL